MSMRVALVLVSLTAVLANGAENLLRAPVHLRSGDAPEWADFAMRTPQGRRLDLAFQSRTNARPATLLIRQEDVRHDWNVEVNGRRAGKLFLMEADLVHALTLPPGTLRDGSNRLAILPPRDDDDIFIHDVRVDHAPLAEAVGQATLAFSVRDNSDGTPLPARLTIVNAQGALAPLVALSNAPFAAVRPGVVYFQGAGRMALPAGDYTVYASRGFEWSVATQRVQVAKGRTTELNFTLRREVATPGLVSCDTHVHTLTHSGHGDATLDERMLTLAGEGIELPIATEHNRQADYDAPARRVGVRAFFTPVPGNEVTTPAGHFNIFPARPSAAPPDHRITDWPELMRAMRATPDVRVVVLNHPRSVHNGFQPFAATNFNRTTGRNQRGPEFTFDALEVLNSSAQQSDFTLVYRDWFALLNRGLRITAVGSSDGHDVSRYIVGQGRTYIAADDRDPSRIDVNAACEHLLAGRALVSMGLLADMTVDGRFGVGDLATGIDRELRVSVRVLGPSWVTATNVTLFANGVPIREQRLARSVPGPLKGTVSWKIPVPAHDVHLVSIAAGPGITAPFWAIPRPYQPTAREWTPRVIASTNPIRVDADGDGAFSSARDYAAKLVREHLHQPARLCTALAAFDQPVATHAAELCADAGAALDSQEWRTALGQAAPHVRREFKSWQRWR